MNIPFRDFFVLWAVFGERYVDHFSAKRTCIPIVVFFPYIPMYSRTTIMGYIIITWGIFSPTGRRE